MDYNMDFLIEAAAAYGSVRDGYLPGVGTGIDNDALYFAMAKAEGGIKPVAPSTRNWSDRERQFLIDNLAQMNDGQIAEALGRTQNGVKIYRQRNLQLPATTRLPEQPSLTQVALLFSVDSHAVIKWADRGLIESHDTLLRVRGDQHTIRTVNRAYLKWWALQPQNWMLFKADRITDPSLRRLVQMRQERWGDEWLTTGQIAKMWHCQVKNVNNMVRQGVFPGVVRWGNWWVRKSVVMQIRRPQQMLSWPVEQDMFMVLAHAVGLSFPQMERMGTWPWKQLQGRFHYLRHNDLIPALITRGGLQVRYRHVRPYPELFADWRDYQDRFPGVTKAVARFKAGNPKPHDLDYIQAILKSWARWYGPYDLAQSLTFIWRGRTRLHVYHSRLISAWKTLQANGIEPL